MKRVILQFQLLSTWIAFIAAQNVDIPGLTVMSSGERSAKLREDPSFDDRRSFNRPHRVSVGDAPIFFPVLQPVRGDGSGPIALAPEDRTAVIASAPTGFVGEDPHMELPEDLDLEHMKVGVHERELLSNLQSADDFIKLFNLQTPVEDEDGIFARFGGAASMDTVNAICAPENKTVRLDLPRELNVVFFPRCVRLMRCGGCCHGPLLSCQPTKRSSVTLKILKVGSSTTNTRTRTRNAPEGSGRSRNRSRPRNPSRGSTRNTRSRSRREETTTYVDVNEFHDTECKCMCRIKPEHCDSQIHNYVADDCQCQCKNTDEQGKCEKQVSTHYWDNKSCSCYCLKEETCSTGQRFDHTTCSCVQFASFLRRGASGRSAADSFDYEDGEVLGEPPVGGPISFGRGK